MKKVFWDHLIEITDIERKIDEHGVVKEEKHHLLRIVHQTFDAKLLEEVLTHLPEKKHQTFLDKFSKEPHHSSLLDHLKEEIEDIEEKIKKAVKKIKKEILEELHKL